MSYRFTAEDRARAAKHRANSPTLAAHNAVQRAQAAPRLTDMLARRNAGETLAEIAIAYDISTQRVHALLAKARRQAQTIATDGPIPR